MNYLGIREYISVKLKLRQMTANWGKSMRTIKILGSLAGLLVIAGIANADDTNALIDLDKKWGESEGVDALAPMLSDDILSIGVEGLIGKAKMLEAADEAEPATAAYDAGDYKVQFLSDDVAVMVHSTQVPEPHWSMHVWQKLDGEWRVTATASVPIEE
jgi:hypothetical protein